MCNNTLSTAFTAQTGFCPAPFFRAQSMKWVSWNTYTVKLCAPWFAKGVGRPIFKVLVIGWNSATQESPKQNAFQTCNPTSPNVHTLIWECGFGRSPQQLRLWPELPKTHRAQEPPQPVLGARVKTGQDRHGKTFQRTVGGKRRGWESSQHTARKRACFWPGKTHQTSTTHRKRFHPRLG